jgi:hypothetical protein
MYFDDLYDDNLYTQTTFQVGFERVKINFTRSPAKDQFFTCSCNTLKDGSVLRLGAGPFPSQFQQFTMCNV